MAKKIAMLFPYAPSYREGVYKLMDQELEVDWFFCGNAKRNLKLLDYSCLKRCNLLMQEKSIFGNIVYYKGIKDLNLENYDYIICAGVIRSISEWWLLRKLGKEMKNSKVFLWTHGWYGKESYIQRIIKKIFFKKVDGFFLYGDYAKTQMIEAGFEPQRLHVIKNSLDYEKQIQLRNSLTTSNIYKSHFKNDLKTIIFIGRLTPVKKLDLLVSAIHILNTRGEYYNIVFVGDGEMKNPLMEEVKKYDLCDYVWFYGECFDEKINAELIFNADVCVAPGNIGLTAIHSLMFGCPCISHNNYEWQMPEFEAIDNDITGAFFKYDDVEDLAQCVSNWFESKGNDRNNVRKACYNEIDSKWNPRCQVNLIKKVFEIQ